MWRYWWVIDRPAEPASTGWPIAALFGLSLILLGALIVIEPVVLALLAASVLIGTGLLMLVLALMAAWTAWRTRPRRIRIRSAG